MKYQPNGVISKGDLVKTYRTLGFERVEKIVTNKNSSHLETISGHQIDFDMVEEVIKC